MENDRNLVELIDENGNELSFEHIMTFEHDENIYVALVDADTDPQAEEADVLILRVEEGEGDQEDTYVDVEDEAELQAAFNTFVALLDEEDDENGAN
ncbi:MAG: DUF1292 domain-containing protein [Christensenellales bacterium]|jgi:uncharacterized protein YrzB (UPF0473 family)